MPDPNMTWKDYRAIIEDVAPDVLSWPERQQMAWDMASNGVPIPEGFCEVPLFTKERYEMVLSRIEELDERHDAHFTMVLERARRRWINMGGCPDCNGWGRILTWSTMDGSSWDEFETCRTCGGHGLLTRAADLFAGNNPKCPGSYPPGSGASKRMWGTRQVGSVMDAPGYLFATQEEFDEYQSISEALERAKDVRSTMYRDIHVIREHNVVEAKSKNSKNGIQRGDRMVVFWTREEVSRYGYQQRMVVRVGGYRIVDGAATTEKVWTTGGRVEVVARFLEHPEVQVDVISGRWPVVRRSKSGKAVAIDVDGPTWLPISQILIEDDVVVSMPLWLARDKGLVSNERVP